MMKPAVSAAMAASLLFFASCAKKNKTARVPPAPQPATRASAPPPNAPPGTCATCASGTPMSGPLPVGYSEQGIASWYGIPYHGRPAADGEIYDMEKLVAAHRLMPFNTWLKVTNLTNNKSVTVRVIDRGPFVDGRIIDLSKAAAREIDLLGPGVGPVKLEVVAAPPDIAANDFYAVQVGAFAVYANADRVRADYAQRYGSAQMVAKAGATPVWRVLVGKAGSIPAAQDLANQIRAEGKDVFVVRLDTTVPAATSATTNQQLPLAPTVH